jgi:hypothetical protein
LRNYSINLSKEKKDILNHLVADLAAIDHVVAVVLGGSHVTGWANENSDLDIGIYYYESLPFNTEQIKLVAQKYNVNKPLTVTGFYQWGPWVNGGAWVNTASGEVDFVYRNINQVKATIEKAQNGLIEYNYEQQPPFGFSSIIYLSEIYHCIPLHDPDKIVEGLKKKVSIYPPKLKKTIIQQSLWQAEFSLWHAEKFAKAQDVYNTIGCLSRSTKYIVESLFALNEIYPMGDKWAIDILKKTTICPVGFDQQINNTLSLNEQSLLQNVAYLNELFKQTVQLAREEYVPLFQLK